MKKITSIVVSCFVALAVFSSFHANAYNYLDTATLNRLESDYKNYSGNKETYLTKKISQVNTMLKNEKDAQKRVLLMELRTFYTNKKQSLLNVDDVVDELFGTKVEYKPSYNIPDIPVAQKSYISQSSSNNSVVEFRWSTVSNAEYYQIKFDNGTWTNNKSYNNHKRTVNCGKTVHAQVRACNDQGCSAPLYMQENTTCGYSYNDYYNNYNNSYNYNNNYNYNSDYYNTYYNFQAFRDKFLTMQKNEIITNSEYSNAVRDLNSYTDYTKANQFYEGFLKTSYHSAATKLYQEARNRDVITSSEANSKSTDIYNRMYIYNASVEAIYNDAFNDVKKLLKNNISNIADRLVNSGKITYNYRSEALNNFDRTYTTQSSLFAQYDSVYKQLQQYDVSGGYDSYCSVTMNGNTYRLDQCTRSVSMRDGYGDQEFGFTIIPSDYYRNYTFEVSDNSGFPYNAITGGTYSGNAMGSKYISKYFSDRYLDRGNYSGYIRIFITDSYGNKKELRQYINLTNY